MIPIAMETCKPRDTTPVSLDRVVEPLNATNKLMPEKIKDTERDITQFVMPKRRKSAYGTIGIYIWLASKIDKYSHTDTSNLALYKDREVNTIVSIYGLDKDKKSKQFLNSILQVDTVNVSLQITIHVMRGPLWHPMISGVLSSVLAGCVLGAIGEGTIYALEKVCLGEKSLDDIDWVKQVIESQFGTQFMEKVEEIYRKVTTSGDYKGVAKAISEQFRS